VPDGREKGGNEKTWGRKPQSTRTDPIGGKLTFEEKKAPMVHIDLLAATSKAYDQQAKKKAFEQRRAPPMEAEKARRPRRRRRPYKDVKMSKLCEGQGKS